MQLSLSQPLFPAVMGLARRFANWWWKECRDLMPERLASFLASSARKRLTVRAEEKGLSFTLSQGAGSIASMQSQPAAGTREEIDRFLAAQGLARKDVELGLVLPAGALFSRQILLPAEAGRSIDAIVAQDLARKTPFRAGDVYADHAVTEQADGKTLDVRQWIIRRQFVDDAMRPLGLTIAQIDFLTTDARDEPIQPRIRLRRDAEGSRPLHRKLVLAMSCSAVFLALACGGLRYWNQQVVLDRLEGDIAATSRKAQQVRTQIDQLEQKRNVLLRLRLQKGEAPGLIDLWDETTRLLPAHSWLTEFRLSEGAAKGEPQVTLTGYSNAAPALVATIDNSRLLFDAALTAPVALDPAEGKERFTLQAKVRLPEVLKGAAR